MKLTELQERLLTLQNDNETIIAKAESEKRDLSVEESDQFDRNAALFDSTKENIERLNKMADHQALLTGSAGRKTEADPPQQLAGNGQGGVEIPRDQKRKTHIEVRDPYATSKNGGFRTLGDMAWAVSKACGRGATNIDPRLQRIAEAERLAAVSTYGNESTGADGGFAVPPDFRDAIMETVMAEESLLSMCDQVTVNGNQFTCPVDETSPWGSAGIQAYWDGEAVAATQSKPALGERTTKLNKLRCLVPMTEESMADAGALDSWLKKKAPEVISHKVDLAIFSGNGVGTPLGFLNAPCTVQVSKESSQTADTVMGVNVVKMWSRMYAPSRKNAVWLISQSIEPELIGLSLPGRDAVGNAVSGWGGMMYIPPGGLSASPFGTLLGRPVMPNQVCPIIGDKGDICLVDLKQYLAILKSGGNNPRTDVSIHLWFDQDVTAFKFVLRVGGVPWWSTTLLARDGTTTYSPFVTLEAR